MTSAPGWPKIPCSLTSRPGGRVENNENDGWTLENVRLNEGEKTDKRAEGVCFNRIYDIIFSSHTLLHTCVFFGAMGVLGSCLILLSCWEQGGAGESGRREPGREPSNGFRSNPDGDIKW